MITLGVDLAPRYSGFCILENQTPVWYNVVDVGPESDGFESHADKMIVALNEVIAWVDSSKLSVDLVVVEDVSVRMVKPSNALRLQGLVRWKLHNDLGCDILTILPSVWQRYLGYSKVIGVSSKGWAKYVCQALDYESKFEGISAKSQTDIRDAMLIARYGYEKHKDNYE